MGAINIYRRPRLKGPCLVAAWPGMGGVAIVAARYLQEKLKAKEFGGIEPYDFFQTNTVSVRDQLVEKPEFPDNKFYSWSKGGKSLVIFTSEAQPSAKAYQLANLVLDVAQRFEAKMVCTFAAAPTHIYHARKPEILGVATSPELLSKLERHGVKPMTSGGISGMNGLLLGVARQRGMNGFCLLGEIPIYTIQIANPRSSKGVLEILAEMLHLEIDMTDINAWEQQIDEEIEQNIEHLRQSPGEEANRLLNYFEQLRKASAEDSEALPGYASEDLFQQIENFLKKRREQKEEN